MIRKRIEIWENRNYSGNKADGAAPHMDAYLWEGDEKRPCVLVLPGGGYHFLSWREAEPIALRFYQKGYNAFVLYYSVEPNRHPLPLLDASLAVSAIREKSGEWNIEKNKIFVCGFSAGGHLAASLGVHWNKKYISEILDIKDETNKPNGLILCYPVILYGQHAHQGSFKNLLGSGAEDLQFDEMSLEKHVGTHTPPAFLWHTFADEAVPVENTLLFAGVLRKNNIPFEMHIYPEGEHGLSLANDETAEKDSQINTHVSGWIHLCFEWMETVK